MPTLTEADLKLKLKSNPIGAYLIWGDESYLVKVYTDKLVRACVDDSFGEFNLHTFEPDEADLSDIYDSSMAIPMMAESKCVIVKNYPINMAEEGDYKALEELLKENPSDNCLIFSYPAIQPKSKDMTRMQKLFNEYGFNVKLDKKTSADLVRILESGAKKRDRVFDRGAANYLVTNVGDDLNLLNNELEKVCAYSDGTITVKDIDAVCIKSLDARVFDMVNALVAGNFDRAFHNLSNLFEAREDEFMILGALISQYTDIYRAKSATKSGGTIADVAISYQSYKGKDFKLTKAVKAGSTLSFEQLDSVMEILADTDLLFKSTQQDKKQVLEQTLVRITRACGR